MELVKSISVAHLPLIGLAGYPLERIVTGHNGICNEFSTLIPKQWEVIQWLRDVKHIDIETRVRECINSSLSPYPPQANFILPHSCFDTLPLDVKEAWFEMAIVQICNDLIDEQFKTITFYVEKTIEPSVLETYGETSKAIDNGCHNINTYSMAHLSFGLLDSGYKIFIVGNNGVRTELFPGMRCCGGKEIRQEHNLFKLFRAGIFEELTNVIYQ